MHLKNLIELCKELDDKYDNRCTVREVSILLYLLEKWRNLSWRDWI